MANPDTISSNNYSYGQEVAVLAVSTTAATFSFIGSLTMARLAVCRGFCSRNNESSNQMAPAARSQHRRHPRHRNAHNDNDVVYHRLVLALSLADIITSVALIFYPFLNPSDAPKALSFVTSRGWGNRATCTLVGYVGTAGLMMTAFCNAGLAWYFYLTVVKSWRPRDFAKSWLPKLWAAILLIVPNTVGITGVLTESFNPLEQIPICWLTEFYYRCEEHELCLRGGPVSEYLDYVLLLLIFMASIIAGYFTVMVYASYRRVLQRARRYDFGSQMFSAEPQATRTGIDATDDTDRTRMPYESTNNATNAQQNVAESPEPPRPKGTKQQFHCVIKWKRKRDLLPVTATATTLTSNADEQLKQLAMQAVRYCLIYANQILWLAGGLTIGKVSENTSGPVVYGIVIVGYIFQPSAGLFNALVYLRPSYVALRDKRTFGSSQVQLSRWQACWYSALGKHPSAIQAKLTAQKQKVCKKQRQQEQRRQSPLHEPMMSQSHRKQERTTDILSADDAVAPEQTQTATEEENDILVIKEMEEQQWTGEARTT